MPNNEGISTETLLPIALVAGAGLLIWSMSRQGTQPTGYCVPQDTVRRLMSIPGLTNPHPTAICRYYAATAEQQQHFWTLDPSLQVTLMQMSPEQALWFTCWACPYM
jgi:hypothetical protein